MPRNGSGQYQLPAGNPVVTGSLISSSGWANPTLNDLAAAITNSIAADGQTVPTANLPMGNFRHTSVANAQARTDYAAAAQVQDDVFNILANIGGTGDAITATLPLALSALATGATYIYTPIAANTTTAPTISINGIAARTILDPLGNALEVGALKVGALFDLVYDGASLRASVSTAPPDGSVTFAKLASGIFNDPGWRYHAIGESFDWTGPAATIPAGAIEMPLVPTNVSRTTYAALFAIYGTMYGAGDGSTTFGIPYVQTDQTTVHNPPNVGTQTVGANIAHTHGVTDPTHAHNIGIAQQVASQNGSSQSAMNLAGNTVTSYQPTGISIQSSGGSANLAAGLRVIKCLQVL